MRYRAYVRIECLGEIWFIATHSVHALNVAGECSKTYRYYDAYALPSSTAGADIKQLAKLTYAEAYGQDVFKEWTRLTNIRKPVRY